jgi:hypothetical protein
VFGVFNEEWQITQFEATETIDGAGCGNQKYKKQRIQ